MKREIAGYVAPLVAAVVLVIMLMQTRAALKASGTWNQHSGREQAVARDPYAPLDRDLAEVANAPPVGPVRDPFSLTPLVAELPVRHEPRRPVAPPPPPLPVLTAIIWDNDPRATVRWNGRDYSVRNNTLFADFRVAGISRDQVVLERGGERLVLTLPKKGD